MKKIKMISFDADQTLFDFKKILVESLTSVCEWLNARYETNVTLDEFMEARKTIDEKYRSVAVDMLEIRRLSFKKILDDHGIKDENAIKEMLLIFQKTRFGKVYFYEDTIPTLERLKEDYLLAVITNGNSHPRKAGIGAYFSFVITGEKYAFKKPDRRLFEELIIQSKISGTQIVHVGDSLSNDVKGAQNAGIHSIWLNMHGRENKSDIIPNYDIQNLGELPELLTSSFQ